MNYNELFKQIIFNMWSHKLRTFAALFGIVWGTITVIVLLALSNGFYAKSTKNLAFLNNGTIFGWPGTTTKPYAGLPQGQVIHIKIKDILEIVQDIPGIKSFSPIYNFSDTLYANHKHVAVTIQGVSAGYDMTQQMVVSPGGRFINPLDVKQTRRVIFLDDAVKKILFGSEEAVHQTITLRGIPFLVVGVSDPDHESVIRMTDDKNAYIPFTTYLSILGQQDINMVFITPESPDATARIKKNLKNMLSLRFHYDPTDDNAFAMPDLEKAQTFVLWFFRVIEFFLLFCGVLTLSVGGVGTANMMFLMVSERTREIGLRMALGAQYRDIMQLFLLETVVLVLMGGVLGAIVSLIMLFVLRQMHLPDWLGMPFVSLGTVVITIITLASVGIIAGYFPAKRAASMEPVKALAF